MPRVFLWFESLAWSSKVSARFASVAVRAMGEMEFKVDQRDSKISPEIMPVPGINVGAN